jgi:hypothetical protein
MAFACWDIMMQAGSKYLIAFCFIVLAIMICSPLFQTTNPGKPTPEQNPKVTSAARLSAAKFALDDGYKPEKDITKTSWGAVPRAREHLEAIRPEDREYEEAKTLLLEV